MLWIAFLGSFLSSEMKSPQDLIVMKRLVALIIDVILALVILGTTAARYKYKKHRTQNPGYAPLIAEYTGAFPQANLGYPREFKRDLLPGSSHLRTS